MLDNTSKTKLKLNLTYKTIFHISDFFFGQT